MDIGTHCNYCGRLDFLPFDCRKCGKVVCGEHRIHHDCVKEAVLPLPESPPRARATKPKTETKPPPAKPPAAEAKLQATPASGTKLGAQKGAAKTERAAAAFERLRILVGGSGRSQAPKQSARPALAASSVAPAELKKAAVGDQNVKFSDRLYYRVERPAQPYKDPLTGTQATRPAKTMPLFFSKTLTIGQVLDKAAPHLGYNAQGAGLRRMNGSALDLSSPISSVPQGATLMVTL